MQTAGCRTWIPTDTSLLPRSPTSGSAEWRWVRVPSAKGDKDYLYWPWSDGQSIGGYKRVRPDSVATSVATSVPLSEVFMVEMVEELEFS